MRFLPGTILLALLPAAASAQPALRVERVSEPPRLEDYLDGSPPAGIAAVTGFVQREPGDGVPATQSTTAYVSYDDDHLYVVFVCEDTDPRLIRARLTRREDVEGDDVVGVVLDTFYDQRRSYVFMANPHGVQLDGIVSEGQEDDYSFDTLWRSEGRLTPFGYVVRFELPFKSLRFPAVEKQTWGIALARLIPRTNEDTFWPYITRRVAGFGQQLAQLDGLERISPGRNIQLIPYGVFAGARVFVGAPAGAYQSENDARVGLDGKIVLKDAFTLDLALNPDFSQVESDEPQVTINQRFEVFFPERRPFFIENATYFETPIQLVFSRRIVDPQVGARATGKSGGWALGALAIDDRAPGRRLAPPDPGAGDRAAIGIVRAQRDFGEQSSLGMLATSRDFAGASSRVASADGRWKLTDNWIAHGQVAFSQTREPGTAAEAGGAVSASLFREARTFSYAAEYLDISPQFRAPLGFVPRVDIRQVEQRLEYNWRPDGRAVLRYGPELELLANWDHAGRLQDWQINPEFDLELTRQTYLFAGHAQSFELFEGIEFRKHASDVAFESAWFTWLSGGAGVTWGTEINFFPGGGAAPFLAAGREAEANVTVRPGSRLRVQQGYLYSSLSTRGAGETIFTNHILRSRVTYQFTRAFSLRAIVDYATVRPTPGLVEVEDEETVTADLLFTWLLNPGTAVYVGYTDRYERLDPFEFTRAPGLRSTGRQVFVKGSYLFRF